MVGEEYVPQAARYLESFCQPHHLLLWRLNVLTLGPDEFMKRRYPLAVLGISNVRRDARPTRLKLLNNIPSGDQVIQILIVLRFVLRGGASSLRLPPTRWFRWRRILCVSYCHSLNIVAAGCERKA